MGFMDAIGNVVKGTAKFALSVTRYSLENASRDDRFSDEERDWASNNADKLKDFEKRF